MANVIQPSIAFPSHPVAHPPNALTFGFGLNSAPSAWPSLALTPGHTNPASFQQLASSMNQHSPSRAPKRRLDAEDDDSADKPVHVREQSMDRSPTPERPRRAVPKRARVVPDDASKDGSKRGKSHRGDGEDVDVGVLLASLPPQSLLPLLTSLLSAHPSLKAVVLPLIPRPTLDVALLALAQSAKKLRDAFPYSNSPVGLFSQSGAPSVGFGAGYGGTRASNFGAFGRLPQSSASGQAMHPSGSPRHASGMRDSYILSRLRPHIDEFVSACMSYLPYFSYLPTASSPSAAGAQGGSSSSSSSSTPSAAHSSVRSHATLIQALHKDASHPTETFAFLAALTTHLQTQPALAQGALAPLLVPRLTEEWGAWVARVDAVVNREGGMFGQESVTGWVKSLDEFAANKGAEGYRMMREVRDRWVAKVGWLVGRVAHYPMEEEEEEEEEEL